MIHSRVHPDLFVIVISDEELKVLQIGVFTIGYTIVSRHLSDPTASHCPPCSPRRAGVLFLSFYLSYLCHIGCDVMITNLYLSNYNVPWSNVGAPLSLRFPLSFKPYLPFYQGCLSPALIYPPQRQRLNQLFCHLPIAAGYPIR